MIKLKNQFNSTVIMSPKNIENFSEDVNVIDVASEPVNEEDTSKKLGDTRIERKLGKSNIGEQNQERIREVMAKKDRGEPLSAAEKVVLGFAEKGKKQDVKEVQGEKAKSPEIERKSLVFKFLESFREENRKRSGLSENRREKLDQALKTLDRPEGIKLGEKIIGTVIRERAEDLEKFPNLNWAEADKRIMEYISGIILEAKDSRGVEAFLKDNRISDFENYLDIAKDRISDNAKRQKIIKLAEQINKFKKSAESPLSVEAKPKREAKSESVKATQPEVLRLTDERKKEKIVPEETRIELTPVEAFKSLNDEKKEIEIQLSRENDAENKKKLLAEKRKISEEMIERASQLPEFKNIKKEIEIEKEKEWEKGIALSGYKDMAGYREWHKNVYCSELIKNSSLSEKQKEDALRDGAIIVGGWPKTIELSRDDIVAAIKMGLDINQIRGIGWHPFSKKIMAGEQTFDNIDKFNDFLEKGREDFNKDIQERMNKRKNEIIDRGSADSIIDNRINKIMEFFSSKEKKTLIEEKKETQAVLSIENKLHLLNEIKKNWGQAERIGKALKTSRDIKIAENEVLNSKTQQTQIEGMKEFRSDYIINIADVLSGRKLRKEALDVTGYKLDKDPEKQKEYQKWLTDEVKKIYKEQIEGIEKETGKKIKIVSEKKKLSKTNERKFRSGIKKDAKIKPLINREKMEEE